jgi:photosystem II stability/assembly factor-like uncharacterized protein
VLAVLAIAGCHLDSETAGPVFDVEGDASWLAFSRLLIRYEGGSGKGKDPLFDDSLKSLSQLRSLPGFILPDTGESGFRIQGWKRERLVLDQTRLLRKNGKVRVDTAFDAGISPRSVGLDTLPQPVQLGGAAVYLQARFIPAYADTLSAWSVGDSGILELESGGGAGTSAKAKIKPLKPGETVVRIRSLSDTAKSASIKVTILRAASAHPPILSAPESLTTKVRPEWRLASGGAPGCGSFRVKLDDSSFATGFDTLPDGRDPIFIPKDPLEDGNHFLYAQEKNCLGDWSASASLKVRIRGQTGFAVGDSGLLIRTQDAGKTWSTLPRMTSSPICCIQFPSPDTGYAAAGEFVEGDPVPFKGILLKTMDGGRTWKELPNSRASWYTGILFLDAGYGLYIGYRFGGHIGYSTNGGESFTELGAPIFRPYAIQALSDQVIYIAGMNGASKASLARSFDKGKTWDSVPAPATPTILAMRFQEGGKGVIGTVDGNLYRTLDSGKTWSLAASRYPKNINGFDFTNAKTGYSVASGGLIMKSTDGGATWTDLASGTTEDLHAIHFADDSTGYAAGAKGVLLKTTDSGRTWKPLPEGEDMNFLGVYFP